MFALPPERMSSPRRERIWYRACVLAGPVLLCVVASLQIARVVLMDQSPWKGGGFGMFASPDSPDTRLIKLFLITPDGPIPAEVPRSREALAVRTTPTPAYLGNLAEQLSRVETWVRPALEKGKQKPARPLRPGDTPRPGDSRVCCSALRVELWRMSYDATQGQIESRKRLEVVRPRLDP